MRLLKGRPPALWLAIVAAVGLLIALATAAPPAVTYRSNGGPGAPIKVPVAKATCSGLPVLPRETRAVRLTPVKGHPVPDRASLQLAGKAPIALGPPVRVDGGARVMYRLPHEVEASSLGLTLCLQSTVAGAQVAGSAPNPSADLLGAERGSWLEALPLLASRAAFGRALVGPLALPLALLLLIAAWVLVVRTVPRGVVTPVDARAIRRVAAVALCLGSAYAITTPALEAPDEMVHLHYVDVLRDRHEIPQSTRPGPLSSQMNALIGTSRVSEVAFQPSHRPPWTRVEDRAATAQLAATPSGDARDVFTNASSQPPGYYALGAVVTTVTGGDELRHLLVMRLLSAFLMAFSVAGALVFARAAVPSAGGLVLVGGLILAALPITGFIGGSVNPDSAYTAASAWALAAVAVMIRSGLTMRRALWLAAATVCGMLSKLTFLPMLAVIGLGAVIVVVREVRAGRGRSVLRPLLVGGGLIVLIGVPYYAWAKLSGRGVVFNAPGGAVGGPATPMELLSYAFELYVGQVGPILDRIPGSGPQIFVDGLVGRLGWLDYGPGTPWTFRFEYLWLALGALAAVGVVRAIVRRRGPAALETLLWVVGAIPLLLVVAHAGLIARHAGSSGFEQARYLFPLAPFAVAGIGLAIRQLPTRAHAWTAATLGILAVVHGTVLWLMTIGRYFA